MKHFDIGKIEVDKSNSKSELSSESSSNFRVPNPKKCIQNKRRKNWE